MSTFTKAVVSHLAVQITLFGLVTNVHYTFKINSFVKIWRIKDQDGNKITPSFVSELSRHSSCVNIVRFSPNGKGIDFTFCSPHVLFCTSKYTICSLLICSVLYLGALLASAGDGM